MIHHYITKYIENEKMYVEAWIQIDIFGQCICFSNRRIEVNRNIDITRMDICDFCSDEKHKHLRDSQNVNNWVWSFDMWHKTLRLCTEHMNELRDYLNKLKQENEI